MGVVDVHRSVDNYSSLHDEKSIGQNEADLSLCLSRRGVFLKFFQCKERHFRTKETSFLRQKRKEVRRGEEERGENGEEEEEEQSSRSEELGRRSSSFPPLTSLSSTAGETRNLEP